MTLKLKNTNFMKIKPHISMNDLDINEITLSSKLYFGK